MRTRVFASLFSGLVFLFFVHVSEASLSRCYQALRGLTIMAVLSGGGVAEAQTLFEPEDNPEPVMRVLAGEAPKTLNRQPDEKQLHALRVLYGRMVEVLGADHYICVEFKRLLDAKKIYIRDEDKMQVIFRWKDGNGAEHIARAGGEAIENLSAFVLGDHMLAGLEGENLKITSRAAMNLMRLLIHELSHTARRLNDPNAAKATWDILFLFFPGKVHTTLYAGLTGEEIIQVENNVTDMISIEVNYSLIYESIGGLRGISKINNAYYEYQNEARNVFKSEGLIEDKINRLFELEIKWKRKRAALSEEWGVPIPEMGAHQGTVLRQFTVEQLTRLHVERMKKSQHRIRAYY